MRLKKAIFIILVTGLIPFLLCSYPGPNQTQTDRLEELYSTPLADAEAAFLFLGYSGVIVRMGGKTVIIDPASSFQEDDLEVLKNGGVDLLLFTHGHGDHFIPYFAEEIYNTAKPFVGASPTLTGSLKDQVPPEKMKNLVPGKSYTFDSIKVDVIKGIHIGPIELFRVTIGNISLFHGGDSAYVALKNFPSQLAFLPTGDPSPTASPDDAFRMAADLNPKAVVAVHGSPEQSEEFRKLMQGKFPATKIITAKKNTIYKVILN